MGYEKMVCKKDEQEAAAAGLLSKPLTQPGVEKALKDFGVDSEAASHSPIASLSHGQKVKVVICAAMWQNPHVVILDEPTNYLDRDGLGALIEGLHEIQVDEEIADQEGPDEVYDESGNKIEVNKMKTL